MPGPRRTRRPLIALVVLLLILGVGYAVQALRDDDGKSNNRAPTSPSVSASTSTARSTATTATATTTGPTAAQSGAIPGAVALSTLPVEAKRTVALIKAGGPFPYSRDGVIFRNAERHLPTKAAGYYHEYTVRTPGESDRGARRIITGGAGEFYYTADHYDSFVRVDVNR